MPYTVGNHTIEFGEGSSILDPWSSDYCRKMGLSMICTSDITSYMRVDGEQIYHLRNSRKCADLMNALEDGSVETLEELFYIFDDVFDDFVGNFSEMNKKIQNNSLIKP